MNILINVVIILLYQVIILAVIPITLKLLSTLDKELIRKLQHIGFTSSIFFLIHLFDEWYEALIPGGVLIILGFPFLYGLEKTKLYNKLLVDRKKYGGEMKISLLLSQLSFTILIITFWGLLGDAFKFVIPVAILSWGIGDALAAVIGKRYGKHKNILPGVDQNKTILGSSVMFLSVLLAVFFMLLVYADFEFIYKVILAFFIAPFATLIELYSKKGLDTITLPLGVAFLLLFGVYLLELMIGGLL